MKLPHLVMSANGNSRWLPVGPWLINPAGLGLALTFSFDANLTATAQYTYDDPTQTPKAVTLARSGANLTVTLANHDLNVGDSIELSNPTNDTNNIWGGTNDAPVNYDVASVTDGSNFVVTVANAGSTSGGGAVRIFRVFAHPTLRNVGGSPPARIDGGFDRQIGAYRLQVTSYVAGRAILAGQQGKGG